MANAQCTASVIDHAITRYCPRYTCSMRCPENLSLVSEAGAGYIEYKILYNLNRGRDGSFRQ